MLLNVCLYNGSGNRRDGKTERVVQMRDEKVTASSLKSETRISKKVSKTMNINKMWITNIWWEHMYGDLLI